MIRDPTTQPEIGIFAEVPRDIPSKQQIEGLVTSLGNVWCFLNDSSKIHQFNQVTGAHLATFDGSTTCPSRGECLSTTKVGSSRPSVFDTDSQSSDGGNNTDDAVTEITESEEMSSTKTIYVTSLKAIQNTLWVGRSPGDVLIINSCDNFAKIEAVLAVDPIVHSTVGPVKHILYPVPGKVVALRDERDRNGNSRYHILIWEDWSSKEANKFEYALRLQ